MFEIVFEICGVVCCIVITCVLTYLLPQLAIICLNDVKDDRKYRKEMKIEMFDEIEPKW